MKYNNQFYFLLSRMNSLTPYLLSDPDQPTNSEFNDPECNNHKFLRINLSTRERDLSLLES